VADVPLTVFLYGHRGTVLTLLFNGDEVSIGDGYEVTDPEEEMKLLDLRKKTRYFQKRK
jgi:hypothetical protein